jgi:hypothetical protein
VKRVIARAHWTASAAKAVARATEYVATVNGVADGITLTMLGTKVMQWAHIGDEEALQIARQLTQDILSLKSSNL